MSCSMVPEQSADVLQTPRFAEWNAGMQDQRTTCWSALESNRVLSINNETVCSLVLYKMNVLHNIIVFMVLCRSVSQL